MLHKDSSNLVETTAPTQRFLRESWARVPSATQAGHRFGRAADQEEKEGDKDDESFFV